ncbi:hypothetical protein [Nocardioides jensenii]|uniref:hypothetical protein n=1 Tax=Nocardioides jensenii TaxID=1843 RepID=UPI000A9B2A14|nr:hypothetical protein [Nocardioides jensenii]
MSPTSLPPSGFAPVITLTVADTVRRMREQMEHARQLVRSTFDRVDVEDCDIYDFQGVDVGYLRFFHRTPRHDVIVEMWSWQADGRVWSMVASADHRDHPDFTDLFDDVAATFDLSGAALAS